MEVETLGFHQQITGVTRTWRGQRDLDQVWTNIPESTISTDIKKRGSSDHSVVSVVIRMRGTPENSHEYLCRKRNNFNLNR